eukprot:TRINITY_DN8066_c0_g1_i1.p1 TRINITY_DN8066_c0_g1~~TRINITY_DN8066_c0_g1_i1.p1  ORF type:complete len:389 (+),score=105.67 TRINITY_DN8066_c0_g1_i1:142-1167(+)
MEAAESFDASITLGPVQLKGPDRQFILHNCSYYLQWEIAGSSGATESASFLPDGHLPVKQKFHVQGLPGGGPSGGCAQSVALRVSLNQRTQTSPPQDTSVAAQKIRLHKIPSGKAKEATMGLAWRQGNLTAEVKVRLRVFPGRGQRQGGAPPAAVLRAADAAPPPEPPPQASRASRGSRARGPQAQTAPAGARCASPRCLGRTSDEIAARVEDPSEIFAAAAQFGGGDSTARCSFLGSRLLELEEARDVISRELAHYAQLEERLVSDVVAAQSAYKAGRDALSLREYELARVTAQLRGERSQTQSDTSGLREGLSQNAAAAAAAEGGADGEPGRGEGCVVS